MAAKKLHQLTPQSSGDDISIENLIEPVSDEIRKVMKMENKPVLSKNMALWNFFFKIDVIMEKLWLKTRLVTHHDKTLSIVRYNESLLSYCSNYIKMLNAFICAAGTQKQLQAAVMPTVFYG